MRENLELITFMAATMISLIVTFPQYVLYLSYCFRIVAVAVPISDGYPVHHFLIIDYPSFLPSPLLSSGAQLLLLPQEETLYWARKLS